MKKNLLKITLLLIAAVMLVSIAFAGAASAYAYLEPTSVPTSTPVPTSVPTPAPVDDTEAVSTNPISTITSDQWNTQTIKSGSYKITDGTAKIKPKYLGQDEDEETILTLEGDLTLDFSGYTKGFDGISDGTENNQGALFGNCNLNGHTLEIKGLNMTSVTVKSSAGYVGGIIGYIYRPGDPSKLILSNCHLVNCSIIGTGTGVAGLVAFVKNKVKTEIKDCTIEHSDVVGGEGYVGGLVGYTYGSSDENAITEFKNCNVENCTVAGEEAGVGGLIGFTKDVAFDTCNIKHTSVYTLGKGWEGGEGEIEAQVGGLAGMAQEKVHSIKACTITNSVIVSSNGIYVGGLVGLVLSQSVDNVDGCSVKASTIVGNKYVGGLVGAASEIGGTNQNNIVKDIAVKGSSNVELIYGKDSTKDIGTEKQGTNYKSTNTGGDTITLYDKDGNEITSFADFWKKISYTTGDNAPHNSPVTVTNIGKYGMKSGYGVGSYVPPAMKHTVTYDGNGNDGGTVPTDSTEYDSGATVTVLGNTGSLTKTGHIFDGWNTQQDGKGTSYAPGATFTINADTTLYAKWTAVITSDQWNTQTIKSGSYKITDGTAKIAPKYRGDTQLTLDGDLTLDFSGYTKGFDGIPDGTENHQGALFGNCNLNGHTLEIKGLNMTSVTVKSSGQYIGGIIGNIPASSSKLILSDCHLVNCSIIGTSTGIGGLVGNIDGYQIKTTISDCTIEHSDVVSGNGYVGGLVGYTYGSGTEKTEFENCNVVNCTVAGGASCVGGLIGYTNDVAFDTCNIKHTSVYTLGEGGDDEDITASLGGLAGFVGTKVYSIKACTITNSVIASDGDYVGGLIGGDKVYNSVNDVKECTVKASTIVGNKYVGGLVGAASEIGGTNQDNTVKDIAVKGSSNVELIYGKDSSKDMGTDKQGTNYKSTNTGGDTITLYDKDGNELTSFADFWKKISYTTGDNAQHNSPVTVTNIGKYSMKSGYGAGLYIPVNLTKPTGITKFQYKIGSAAGYTDYSAPFQVNDKSKLVLNAVLSPGYTFEKWATGVTANPLTIDSVTADISYAPTVTATPTPETDTIIVSTNAVGFGTVDLKTTTAGATFERFLNVTNNLTKPVTLSILEGPADDVFVFSPTSPLPSHTEQKYNITIADAYQKTVGDYSAVLRITDGSTTQDVVLSLSVIDTTGERDSTRVVSDLPQMDVRNNADKTQTVTVDKKNVEIENGKATISNSSDPNVKLVITKVNSKQDGDNQVITTTKDSTVTYEYKIVKADLLEPENEKIDYKVYFTTGNKLASNPDLSLTGDFKDEYADPVRGKDSTARVLSMISSVNDPEDLDKEMKSATIRFEIPKKEITSQDNIRTYHVDGNVVKPVECDVESYGDYVNVEVTTTEGFSAYVVSETFDTGTGNRGHSASISKDYTPSSSVPQMVQETAKPTTTPTAAVPTVMPTTKPTTQATTSKSPAPLAGLIAGLGAAALLIRMRR